MAALKPIAVIPPAEPLTRQRLIDSAILSLATRGYYGTSTVLVTRDAGVSRGTLLHYFPSKAELMSAAFKEAAQRWGKAHKIALVDNPAIKGPADELKRFVDIGWEALCAPAGLAWTELLLAARTDKVLERRVREICGRIDGKIKGATWRLAGELGATDKAAVEAATQFYISALRGLAMDSIRPEAADDVKAAVNIVRETFRAQINAVLPEQNRF